MRTKLFAAGLALLTFAFLPLPSQAQYAGGWKSMLVRTLGPPLINRGINYLMNHRGRFLDDEPVRQQQPYSQQPYSQQPYRQYQPPKRTVSRPAPHTVSRPTPKRSSSSPTKTAKLAVPPPPTMLVPPPPAGVPTGAVLGEYPSDLNRLSSDVPPPPKITETALQHQQKKSQQ